MKMSSKDSGICNLSLYFCKKLNRQIYVEWLELPELKSEEALRLLLNTCNGVVVIIEACDMNHYTVNQYTSLIQTTHKISNANKSYTEAQQSTTKELPVLIVSTKVDIYEKTKNNLSKYALIHNIEEVAINLLSSESVLSNVPTVEGFLERVIEESSQFQTIAFDRAASAMKRSISKHRLEVHSSMGSVRSIPDFK
eukprot:NODE_95_length_21460_cov_0.300220.p12 type:complete len:196 gc:universal NODE_95_length_21460_cov_0.300220:5808-5221(-)